MGKLSPCFSKHYSSKTFGKFLTSVSDWGDSRSFKRKTSFLFVTAVPFTYEHNLTIILGVHVLHERLRLPRNSEINKPIVFSCLTCDK